MKGVSCPDIAYILFMVKGYLRTRVHMGAKSMQFVTRGCKYALVPTLSPPANLPPGERAMVSSSFPSARILLPSVFKTCSREGAAHWMFSAFLMLAALAETRYKEEGCS